jgi:hypothetical protein
MSNRPSSNRRDMFALTSLRPMLTISTSQTGAPPSFRAALSRHWSKPNRVLAPVTGGGLLPCEDAAVHGRFAQEAAVPQRFGERAKSAPKPAFLVVAIEVAR